MVAQENIFSKSLLAGIAISIGCYLFLSSQILGSLFFAICLIAIAALDLNLFTFKACFISDGKDLRRLILVLILNTVAVSVVGALIGFSSDTLQYTADKIISSRLDSSYLSIAISSTVTGFLMLISLDSEKFFHVKTYIPMILCTAAIMVCDCCFSLADAFFYCASSITSSNILEVIAKFATTVIFNFIGCNLYNIFIEKSIYNSMR